MNRLLLINEMRSLDLMCSQELRKIQERRDASGDPDWDADRYASLILSKSNALNGLAILTGRKT